MTGGFFARCCLAYRPVFGITNAMRVLASFLVAVPFVAQGATVTFNQQIAPIIYRNCSPCHRPGEAAPFPLLSYAEVARKGKQIGKATSSHVMPPWKAEPASYP